MNWESFSAIGYLGVLLAACVPLLWLAWRPASPPSELLGDRRDPFQVLGVERTALGSPADSWIWAP